MSVKFDPKSLRQAQQDAIKNQVETIKPKTTPVINPPREKKEGRGRPKTGKKEQVNVSLDSIELDRFREYCRINGFSLSGGARTIILEKLRKSEF